MKEQNKKKDQLRAEFTSWLEKVVYHAKLNYIRSERKYYDTLSLEDILEGQFVMEFAEETLSHNYGASGFDFEIDWLEAAFSELSEGKRVILEKLFVEGKKPSDIATELHCTVQHIYNQQSLAFKIIRNYKKKGINNGLYKRRISQIAYFSPIRR